MTSFGGSHRRHSPSPSSVPPWVRPGMSGVPPQTVKRTLFSLGGHLLFDRPGPRREVHGGTDEVTGSERVKGSWGRRPGVNRYRPIRLSRWTWWTRPCHFAVDVSERGLVGASTPTSDGPGLEVRSSRRTPEPTTEVGGHSGRNGEGGETYLDPTGCTQSPSLLFTGRG